MLAKQRANTSQADELERMAAAHEQAARIEAYLPTLKARAVVLKDDLEELRQLISDEEKALKDLRFEAKHPISVVRQRYKKQGRKSPV